MNLFGMIKEEGAGELGPYVSFRTFPLAFLTLFRCAGFDSSLRKR